MSIINGVKDFVGLDIGTTQLRVVQLRGSGDVRTLVRYGYMNVDNKMTTSDSMADRQRLGQALKQLFSQSGITTNNVAVGLPANKVFTTVVDIDKLSKSEISQSIKLQADSIIPSTLAESKIDWAVIGDSTKDPNKVEVLLSSVSNQYVEARLDVLETAGFDVLAFEPESMAITRSLLPPGANGLSMLIDIGDRATDIVVVYLGYPRLIRSVNIGYESIIKSAMQNLSIDQKQAAQFVSKFGLSKEKLEGQVYGAIIGIVDTLVSEIERSIKFVASKYTDVHLERIIVSGGASTLPEFPLHIANKFGISVEIGNAWRNVSFDAAMQNELLAVSSHFAVAAGLAGRVE